MLRITAPRRYSRTSRTSGFQNTNKPGNKKRSNHQAQKMNPFWSNQSGLSELSYDYFGGEPTSYQHGFQGGQSFGRRDQQASARDYRNYEHASYGNNFLSDFNQANFYRSTEHGQVYSKPPPPWQCRPPDSYATSSRPPTSWQGPANEYSGWGSRTVYPVAPPIRQGGSATVEGHSYEAQYQYAPSHFQYQPTQQFAQFDSTAVRLPLTQQWQPGNSVPPISFTPINTLQQQQQTLDANAPAFIPQRTKKLVVKAFGGRSLVDKKNRKRRARADHGTQHTNVTDDLVQQSILNYGFAPTSWQHSGNDVSNIEQGPDLGANSISIPRIPKPRRRGRGALDVEKEHVMDRPVPTARYLEKANREPQVLKSGRPLLIVLDLNGTLLHRPQIGKTHFTARPHVNEFLHYLFSEHHVLIWSSAMPANVESMAKKLLFRTQHDQLIGCWGRDKLQIPAHAFHQNVYVYKQLSYVWRNEDIVAANPDPVEFWCQENTVLIDDNMDKAASEPFNAILVEDFKGEKEQMESDVLGQVVRYLETLKFQGDVSAYMRSKPFEYNSQALSFDWTTIINDMH